jgi:tetraacyldisaccharide 4'-kinase
MNSRGDRGIEALARRLWRGEAPVLGALLAPAELVFRLAQAAYHGAYDAGLLPRARPPLPTISIGNLAVGGSGKTPVSRWLVDLLLARGERPAILHGGYAGDEPALHRLWHPDVPVFAGRDRARSAARAAAAGATVLVLDDAFQHRNLLRDMDIVLIAAERWTAAPRLLPRGPWREPPAALRRAHLVAVTRKVAPPVKAEAVAHALAVRAPHAAILRLAILPAGWRRWPFGGAAPEVADMVESPRGPAVCGVADPELFLANAEQAGGRVERALVYPDHHAFTAAELAEIAAARGTRGGVVLTTAKDAVKLSAAAPELPLVVLEQAVVVEAGADRLAVELDRVLGRG